MKGGRCFHKLLLGAHVHVLFAVCGHMHCVGLGRLDCSRSLFAFLRSDPYPEVVESESIQLTLLPAVLQKKTPLSMLVSSKNHNSVTSRY